MPRRGRSGRKRQASDNEMKAQPNSEDKSQILTPNDNGTLTEISQEAVGKPLHHANKGSYRKQTHEGHPHQNHSTGMAATESERNENQVLESALKHAMRSASMDETCGNVNIDKSYSDNKEELDNTDWEDGLVATDDHPVTIEVNVVADSAGQKRIRRASAEDKEFSELVHKVHLLCLLARGRLIDSVCDDPLIQASLLSLLPAHLLQISNVSGLTSKALHPLVLWFHNNFRIRNSTGEETPFRFALASALEARVGSPEEIAALSIALFRALNLTTRFVSILDVASLKPDRSVRPDISASSNGIFKTSTLMVSKPKQNHRPPNKLFSCYERDNDCEISVGHTRKSKEHYSTNHVAQYRDLSAVDELNDRLSNSLTSETEDDPPESCLTNASHKLKRKGDLEFEMQLEMILSATAVADQESKNLNAESEDLSSSKRMRRVINEEASTSTVGICTALGSKKVGSPQYWAEVYCNGENLTGRWVHIDAVNLIIDGENKVEAMAAACKTSLRYVVAFAGQGAKDVTRRYCMKWYKIASQRVNSIWWDSVLAPLRELESGATGGVVHLKADQNISAESNTNDSFVPTRSNLEDIELETRALTEPLPTNQQAYKNHSLYALEKWLTKYQVLHPRGPILGFCSGHPVYPRTCVQILKTKERWLREGLQVKANEHPVKELKRSIKPLKVEDFEDDDCGCTDSKENIKLYGKWQLEPLNLPRAVNGIVPKNERGQVDVWSEKCLPPGTVHLRFPRAFSVAKRLEIDYAPAMVGFEFKNGRSYPVFDGIVVCAEFKEALLDAYAEEQERREADEKKRDEAQALSRWYQLLSSIVTRQRLNNRYGRSFPPETSTDNQHMNDIKSNPMVGGSDNRQTSECHQTNTCDMDVEAPLYVPEKDHEHVFVKEYESFDEETSMLTKRCHCGFSVQVEEL